MSKFLLCLLVLATALYPAAARNAADTSVEKPRHEHMQDPLDSKYIAVWLDKYGAAWKEQDTELLLSLFDAAATYSVNPFEKVLVGHDQIADYWNAGAVDGQSDISFNYKVWGHKGNEAFVQWTASIRHTKNPDQVSEYDGVFKLRFAKSADDILICTTLEEWWFEKGIQ